MIIEHEITTREDRLRDESFYLRDDDGTHIKILKRSEMLAAHKYVVDNPDKFPEVEIKTNQ